MNPFQDHIHSEKMGILQVTFQEYFPIIFPGNFLASIRLNMHFIDDPSSSYSLISGLKSFGFLKFWNSKEIQTKSRNW